MPRLLMLADGALHEMFDVLGQVGNVVTVRSTFLFEVGEELQLRVQQGARVVDQVARVRRHAGPDEARTTELELLPPSATP